MVHCNIVVAAAVIVDVEIEEISSGSSRSVGGVGLEVLELHQAVEGFGLQQLGVIVDGLG